MAVRAAAGDRPVPPGLPLAEWWSVQLDGQVTAGPVSDGPRIYLALASGQLTARAASDGHEIWRHTRTVTAPIATDGERLFVVSADAVEALHGDTGRTAWTLPRIAPVAPLVVGSDLLIAVTDTDVVAIRAATGKEEWRRPAGGVKLPPAIDGDHVYTAADDGRLVGMRLKDGAIDWQQFVPGGATALAAYRGRVYVGAGDKRLYCYEAGRKGDARWSFPLLAPAVGRIAVDDEHVYVAAMNNIVRALDRQNGNQRWQTALRQRAASGLYLADHVVFVPNTSTDLTMIYDRGGLSGALILPGVELPTTPHVVSIRETSDGTAVYGVGGTLADEWTLSKWTRAGDVALAPIAKLDPLPGAPYLTDPILAPIGVALGRMLLGDPPLVPFSDVGWPVLLSDPPLGPLTTLPGVLLRPLSPVPPVRRGGPGPGG